MTPLVTSLGFLMGVMAQSILLLGNRVRPLRVERNLLLLSFIFSFMLGAFVFVFSQSFFASTLVFFVPFVALYVLSFRDYLLPRIHEGSILIWNTLLVCLCLSRFGWSLSLGVVLAVCTALCCAVMLWKKQKNAYAKMLFYRLFLLMFGVVAILLYQWSDLLLFFNQAFLSPGQIIIAFFFGMNALYIGAHVLSLDYLPQFSKRKSKKREQYLAFLDAHMSTRTISLSETLLPVLGIAAAFILNHFLHILPDLFLASILIALVTTLLPVADYYHGYPEGYKGKRE